MTLAALARAVPEHHASSWADKTMDGWVYATDVWEAQDHIAAWSPERALAALAVIEAARQQVKRDWSLSSLAIALAAFDTLTPGDV